jgi:hypothetical protein
LTPLAAALVLAVALAAGEGRAAGAPPAPQGSKAANAARAKMGLLPRKAPRAARTPPARRGRVIDTSRHQPTFLAEPGAAAPAEGTAHEVPEMRVAAAGVVVSEVAIVLRY